MIKIEKTEVMGWEAAIRGMRNPMNSWDKSDSLLADVFRIGEKDLDLMKRLRNAGTDHRKYMRMIAVYVDITAPLYWWKEFDTYKVGTVANSCSTMHKIQDKEFTSDDFSYDHLDNDEVVWTDSDIGMYSSMDILGITMDALNYWRKKYFEAKDKPMKEESKRAKIMKHCWLQMIQLLPSSYNQKRTVMLNYEVLANIYHSRKNHKLDEWHEVCRWIEGLPYSELITGDR